MQVICKGLGALGITCTVTQPSTEVVRQNFAQHVNDWGLSYGTQEEYDFRFQIYLENDKIINELNAQPNSFVVAHNMFSTMTKDEYQKHKGRMPSLYNDEAEEEELDTSVMAGSVDWRSKGVVNRVQNQGQCGSCWAFSSVAAIESSYAIQNGDLLKLSEQHFVDCDYSKSGNAGCNGGLEIWAFQYAEENKISLESDYPYKGKHQRCKATQDMGKVGVKSYKRVPQKSVSQLKAAVAKQPTCIGIDAESNAFMFYNKGIIDDKRCGHNQDHAVTAVGYGSENGKQYLLVRNSWGASWGEKGYFRIALDKDGNGICGILLDSTRPIAN